MCKTGASGNFVWMCNTSHSNGFRRTNCKEILIRL